MYKARIKNNFTLIEVIIAGIVISIALYAFNMSLATNKYTVILNKTQIAVQNLAFDYAKRYARCTFEELDNMPANSTKPLPTQVLSDMVDPSVTYYDATPQIDEGVYTVLITPLIKDKNGTPVDVARIVTIQASVALNIPGMKPTQINESATVYVYELQ